MIKLSLLCLHKNMHEILILIHRKEIYEVPKDAFIMCTNLHLLQQKNEIIQEELRKLRKEANL